MATIHAASLDRANLSSLSRWAASVQSITPDQETEIGVCDSRNVVPGFLLDSRLVRVIQSFLSSRS